MDTLSRGKAERPRKRNVSRHLCRRLRNAPSLRASWAMALSENSSSQTAPSLHSALKRCVAEDHFTG